MTERNGTLGRRTLGPKIRTHSPVEHDCCWVSSNVRATSLRPEHHADPGIQRLGPLAMSTMMWLLLLAKPWIAQKPRFNQTSEDVSTSLKGNWMMAACSPASCVSSSSSS